VTQGLDEDERLTERVVLLQEEVRWFKEQFFGRSSKKSPSDASSEQKMLCCSTRPRCWRPSRLPTRPKVNESSERPAFQLGRSWRCATVLALSGILDSPASPLWLDGLTHGQYPRKGKHRRRITSGRC
jgi:hypothetical protein